MLEKISMDKTPLYVEPYGYVVKEGIFIYYLGMLSVNPDADELFDNNVKVQTKQILMNTNVLLSSAGYGVDDVVKTTFFYQIR